MSCGIGCRHSSDMALLLWHRPAATALIKPLAWELPYATGVALKRQKETEKERKRGRKEGRKEGSKEGRKEGRKEKKWLIK